MSERVLVAMSGGVDSSVAAARLVESGLDVVGVTLHLWDTPDDGSVRGRCCAPEDLHDARRVADHLGIAHYSFDRRAEFQAAVVEPFVDGYLAGETPSPCVRCNRTVKIRELLALADRLGAQTVATGHYARIRVEGGRARLHRGADARKDQSYFLHMLSSDVLGRLRFPLGDATKAEVRAEAVRRGLSGAAKGESQELCFVPTGRYDALVEKLAGERVRPGPVLGPDGAEVGRHGGIHRFTVGQRRALGVSLGERSYVVSIDAERAAVQLGSVAELQSAGVELVDVALADDVSLPRRCEAVVRYGGEPREATLEADAAGVRLRFERPLRAAVPGQVAVCFDGTRVLGGGTIRRSVPAEGSS